MPCVATWTDLHIVIQSEVICSCLCVESQKMIQMNLFLKQKQIHRLRKQMYCYQKGKLGHGEITSLGLADEQYYM